MGESFQKGMAASRELRYSLPFSRFKPKSSYLAPFDAPRQWMGSHEFRVRGVPILLMYSGLKTIIPEL